MNLEVVGRHALFFDDDTAAVFVNSGDALVEWHSLQIDRYDVRHLLSVPPPSRRRNRSCETIISDEPSLQSQLDIERYLDLPLHSDQPEVEENEKPLDTGGYRAVAFSYGNSDDSANQINTASGMEASGFLPPFHVPGDILQSLPPTEKVHQIIARTAIFVSKHGGQSEIVLRVKQGDNPTFGFLMPDHHLHAYFQYLVDHPNLLNSEIDGRSPDEGKKDGTEHSNGKGIGGSLSLLGSVYGSGEEEDGDEGAATEKDVSPDNVTVVNHTTTLDIKKVESKADSNKDESVSRNLILSNKEKFLAVKKNSSIPGSRSGSLKGLKKEERSGSSFSAAAGKARSQSVELASKIEPLILAPPVDLKSLIEKLVEFIVRNGKHFEATLIEQDSNHGRFSFLLPTNPYHSYYLKVLQTAEESKAIGKSSYSGKDKASLPKEEDDIPQESDRKEKFKMVIGKLKKELLEKDSKAIHNEAGVTVDAASAAAILQAATRGIKNSNLTIVTTSTSAHGLNRSSNLSEIGPEADSSEAPLKEEQKLKAERLKRAKMFVAMLKSGAAPFTTGTSRCSSMEPLEVESGEVNLKGKEREGCLASANVDRLVTCGKTEKKNFDGEYSERASKRKYRSRSGICEEYVEDNVIVQDLRRSRRKHWSRSRRHEYDYENEDAEETEQKHYRKRHQSHSSSEENKDEAESNVEEPDRRKYKFIGRSHHSVQKDSECEDKDHKRSRKRLSSKHSHEEDAPDNEGRDHKHSRKKHHSHHYSHRCGDENGHSSRDKRSRRHLNHNSSSDDDQNCSTLPKLKYGEKDLEEGEISSRVSHRSRETSVDVTSSQERASSQPAEVPEDLRAKVRAMLMATRL